MNGPGILRFSLFGVPVTIHWFFWLIGLFLGWDFVQQDPKLLLVWMAVWFISFMIHEFGHAFAFRKFGGRPIIHLYGFGGYASAPGRYTRRQSIIISAAGPLVEIAFGILAWVLLFQVSGANIYLEMFLKLFGWICIFWGVVNLLPVLPMDGGRILEAVFVNRMRLVGMIGAVTAAIAAVGFFLIFRSYIAPLFFGFLAYANWQRSRGVQQQFF